jgi:hypothetical protein
MVNIMNWRKSSYSGSNSGNCVEVAAADRVLIRDSKNPDGPRLAFGREAWETFAAKVKAELDPKTRSYKAPPRLSDGRRGALFLTLPQWARRMGRLTPWGNHRHGRMSAP